jgi:large subunit ribosomal protein L10
MNKQEKNEVIELLKGKFSQYNNFYVADTESLSVEQVGKLRRACFDKQVEMRVAKNTLIKKALESLDSTKYEGVYESLHKVTALLFSENPKEPALIISSFRKASNGKKPELKAAFINGDIYAGDESLKALTQIKTKNELIGEVIGLLQSPAKRVLAALLHHHEQLAAGGGSKASADASAATAEASAPATEATASSAPAASAPATEATEATAASAPAAAAPANEASAAPEAPASDAPEAPQA